MLVILASDERKQVAFVRLLCAINSLEAVWSVIGWTGGVALVEATLLDNAGALPPPGYLILAYKQNWFVPAFAQRASVNQGWREHCHDTYMNSHAALDFYNANNPSTCKHICCNPLTYNLYFACAMYVRDFVQ